MKKICTILGICSIFLFQTEVLYSQGVIKEGDPPNRTDIPEFFKSDLTSIEEEVGLVSKGKVKVIAKSPGGFPVYAVFYGEKEDFQSQANYNSAVGARNLSTYARKGSNSKPVVYFLGPVHGQEIEGVVGLVNLIHIAETGKDYRGKEWPSLKQKLEKCRTIIIPCGNPDGRNRCPYDTFLGLPTRIMTKYGQGTRKDGTLWGWPGAKSVHPMKGDVDILGGYFNDDGINIMHDEFFSPMAEETKAILDLAREEAPDLAVSLHSFELISRILPVSYLPWYMKEEVQELSRLVNRAYRSKGLPCYPDEVFGEPSVEDREYPPRASFNLTCALHHTSGCLAFTYECSHGSITSRKGAADVNPDISFEDILDFQLILYETMIDYSLNHSSQTIGAR